jgi:SAM-dependent methyltransferase
MLSFHLNGDIDVSSRSAVFIDRSVEWIASHFNVGLGTKIADFGCGPGLYATRLAGKQASVTGIDFSKRSIEYARDVATREGLSIQYVNQDYLKYETAERFHLILMIMCDFCAPCLMPGGCLLLDVYSLNAFEQREETEVYEANLQDGFWSPHDYQGFLNTFKYETEKVVLDKYTIIEADRTRTVYNWLQYFSPEELEKEFLECGFNVEGIYSDVAGSPFDSEGNEFAVIGRKTTSASL